MAASDAAKTASMTTPTAVSGRLARQSRSNCARTNIRYLSMPTPKRAVTISRDGLKAVPYIMFGTWLVAARVATAPLDADLKVLAALPGEPRIVSAAGITRSEAPMLTIENGAAFDPASTTLRLVIVGGLDGDERGAQAALAAVRWMKRDAPKALRDRWIVSALPMADPDGHARAKPFHFP